MRTAFLTRAASLAAFLLLASAVARSDEGVAVATKENLDLPFQSSGSGDDEEEAPEIVFFYGQQFEGEGFFFCMDRSGSTRQGELEIEKREAIRTVQQFSKRVEFGIVFFAGDVAKWPSNNRPASADGASKSAAIAWMSTIQPGRGSCVLEGLVQTIQFANRSSTARNVVIYLGDGGTNCTSHNPNDYRTRALNAARTANFRNFPINVICVGSDNVNEDFCKALATMNGGSYKRVSR
jgi:Mg-chelatase subunit ChlD